MRRYCYLLLLIFPLTLQAQFTYFLNRSIPVYDAANNELSMPWAGGLNAAQYNTMDLNQDGAEDLVLYDRMGDKVITFLNVDNVYVPAPEFENLFPDISSWLLLRDYNCDGKKDIFTGDVLGIKVFVNTTSSEPYPVWDEFFFSSGFPGSKSPVLLTKGFNSKINLQLQFDDLPSIGDMDADGDLDILNIQYAGNSVEFHKNMSVERYGTCDSLEFERTTRTWGNFRECACAEFAFNGLACSSSHGGRTKHAGGKSLLALDVNSDRNQDLLLSEAECSQLFVLTNEGATNNPVINEFSTYPPNNPANISYPAPYYEDVDFDGKKDLLITPNLFAREFVNTNLQRSNWLYKNTGTADDPVFSFIENNFLQKSMIDIGDNAVPAFADYDADGDQDLFISNYSSTEGTSSIHLYENTGTASSPSFTLISDDYLSFTREKVYNVKIQFSDVNGDNTLDLVFTATGSVTNVPNFYFISNKSQTALDFSGSQGQVLPLTIQHNENFFLTDVNEDGLQDVLVGRSAGQLEYWRNNGTRALPSFVLEDGEFLGLTSSPLRQNLACWAADLDADGKADLIVGDQNGSIGIFADYRNSKSQRTPVFDIVFNSLLEAYTDKNLGGQVWPVAVNLFNTNRPAIVVGNNLGGLHLLTNDEGKSLDEYPLVDIYPNPVGKSDLLKIRTDRAGTIQILSILGQQLSEPTLVHANEIMQYTLPSLASGIYLIVFTSNKKSHAQRLVVK